MHGRISVLLSGSRVLMKTKRVTIKDIAELAGVSKATASLVLNGRGKELRVAQETRERVLAIAREQHYQPSIHARSLRDNRSHTIGLVVPEITNYGFAVFSHELETLCREAGVQLLISCTDENPGQESVVVNNMIARQVDGLIVASCMHSDADYQKLSEQLPVVLFDRSPSDSALPLVMTDSVTPTAELISRIAPQHADEFWFLGGQPRLSPSRDRLAGFTQGLAQAGITLRPEWVINGNYHPSSGYEMFAALCARLGRPPKALFTAACGLLEGVLRYMSQHHLLDSNIHLASFDDHYLYDSLSLRIDTVQQDNRQLAWHCYDLLSQLIDGQAPEPLQRLPARHPADSPSLTARLAISVFAWRAPPASAPAARWRAPRQGRSLPASGKPPATRAIHHPAPASPDSSPPAPRCRSAPGLTSADAGRMAEWSGSGCRTAGAASLAGTAPAPGPARWPAARAMPPADARRHSPAAADNAAPGRGSGERRASPPAARSLPAAAPECSSAAQGVPPPTAHPPPAGGSASHGKPLWPANSCPDRAPGSPAPRAA
ncbi:TPA: LacI family DNA-binding transcriptional regulator [Klebsiella pneumoniae]|nr:LacI family DNA-binding transcriptional regulator [Klebsiella pneumoniae]